MPPFLACSTKEAWSAGFRVGVGTVAELARAIWAAEGKAGVVEATAAGLAVVATGIAVAEAAEVAGLAVATAEVVAP